MRFPTTTHDEISVYTRGLEGHATDAVPSNVHPGPLIPHCKPGIWPDSIVPSRFASHILQSTPATARAALLGLPDDLGVKLNNGRPGAAQGPTAFRAALAKYGVADPADIQFPRVFDAGDVAPAHGHDEAALHATHDRVSEAAAAIVKLGLFPIAIGGGHDLTFAFVRGVLQGLDARDKSPATTGTRSHPTACLYFDPHLDVRNTAGSGMSFRKLVENNLVERLVIAGFNPLVNAREHVGWFKANRGVVLASDWTKNLETVGPDTAPAWQKHFVGTNRIVCSFDLDVLDQSIAPGVSAMNPCGISVATASKALAAITRNPSLCCLDFMELSPPHDEGGRTARVAAHLFLVALAGLMQGPLCHDNSASCLE